MIGQFSRRLLLCLLSFALTQAALAQNGAGTISGRVVDSVGGVLQGAQITLQPGSHSTYSDSQGEFTLAGVPPASYSITASYAGFSPFTGPATVTAGQTTRIEAVLHIVSKSEQVVVRGGEDRAEFRAIERQRAADNIVQALPAETIRSLPNANLADAIGRLSGVTLDRDAGEGRYVQIRGTEPRLSNLTIDGVSVPSPEATVRQVKLDVIPADLVESVEVSKTLSASQDGDAIGGSVNLRTKTTGAQPTLTLTGMGGLSPNQGGRGVSQFGATTGKRFGREQRFGVLVGASYDYNGRGIDDIEASPASNSLAPAYTSFDLRSYLYSRKRYGFGGSVDYRIAENSNIYLRGLYSGFDEYFDKSAYTLTDTVAANGTINGSAPKYLIAGFHPRFAIGNLVAGGKHASGRFWVSWDLAASRARSLDAATNPKGDFKAAGNLKNLTSCKYDPAATTNAYRPQFSAGCVAAGSSVFDASQYVMKDIVTTSGLAVQLNLHGSVSLGSTYRWGSHSGTFLIGGSIRNAHKFQDAAIDTWLPVNGSLPLSSFVTTHTDSNYYGGSYTQGPFGDYGKITSYLNANPGAFTLDYNSTRSKSDPNNYGLTERVSAGYLMNTIDFGRLRVGAGLRFEGTQTNVLGYHVTVNAQAAYVSTTPVSTLASYVDALPSIELRYALHKDTDIRAVYGWGISRPNPYDLVPYINESGQAQTLSIGNPQLKAEHANNYDLLFEQYLHSTGLIQAGFFYKDLSDPIYQFTTTLASGSYAGYVQTQMANGSRAHLMGLEIAYQQPLTFLPGALRGIFLSANYTHTESQAGILPSRSDRPALQRQAPNFWNVSPGYNRGRLSIHAGVSYNGANISSYQYKNEASDGTLLASAPLGGVAGPAGDKYYYPHMQVDAQGSVHLGRGLSAVVYGLNLTNEVFGYYNGSPVYVVQREYYGREIAAGFRWSLSRER